MNTYITAKLVVDANWPLVVTELHIPSWEDVFAEWCSRHSVGVTSNSVNSRWRLWRERQLQDFRSWRFSHEATSKFDYNYLFNTNIMVTRLLGDKRRITRKIIEEAQRRSQGIQDYANIAKP